MEISGEDVGPLIFNNSRLSFAYVPDYENPKDKDLDNVYKVTFTSTDPNSNESTINVHVTIVDVDELGPEINGPVNYEILENSQELELSTYTTNEFAIFSLDGNDAGHFYDF
jgi:hypothetical protein